jgi:hypothetical protein
MNRRRQGKKTSSKARIGLSCAFQNNEAAQRNRRSVLAPADSVLELVGWRDTLKNQRCAP